MNKLLIIILLIFLIACSKGNETKLGANTDAIGAYQPTTHNLLDQSMMQVPLDYPVKDLQKMINRIMPDTLVNDSIDLDDKGDYLVLTVMPIGNLLLSGYQNNLDASIPVKAAIYVKKKMVAFNIKNKKPIELKLRMDLHTELSLDENFDLKTECSIRKIYWIEEPKMKVAGININLKKTVDKQLEKNSEKIEAAICKAINEAVPIQKEVLAIWKLLNQTHRVAKRPIDIWLTTVPKDFSAKFETDVLDTLRVMLYAKAGVLITPLKGIELDSIEKLPTNQKFNNNEQLDLKVSVNMPYEYMNLILNGQLKGQHIEYAGLAAELSDFKTESDTNKLKLGFKTKGDIEIDMESTAKPNFNDKYELVFDDLKYEVISDNPLVNSLDWISNSSVDEYLLQRSKIPLAHILDSLDFKIVRVLDRSKLSSKLQLDLTFSNILPDTIIYYNDRFEWIFSVKGNAHAYLNDSLVEKKIVR
ncbi:DUF4403 family protein [Fulvivirga lutimaris]|uniref:DUF4403 family protein n=1 Tax=Fulvivirga lutimaris TaxID=1819566 RepID=UPI0012BC3D40|nr:DUF4403 family protein [Fulvivirga lutimaris]MTI39550.1 DUF4403 family protein [Fulvivirga lutimaris]